ncbi:hypothetical protein ACFYNL_38260 [Streptomyces sp. NPDC007808]|uniref:hypothetical protein n=1 Tax=Streptomyces sp. NPDC007808 TaxID=3364779 RepID=UPI0036CBE19A
MTSSAWDRAPRRTAAASVLTLITVVVSVLVWAVGVSVPEAWWPHTGHAFAADTHPTNQDACALIVGSAKAYCERGTTTTAPAPEQPDMTGAAWRLVPVCAGLAALAAWRLRTAGQGRR